MQRCRFASRTILALALALFAGSSTTQLLAQTSYTLAQNPDALVSPYNAAFNGTYTWEMSSVYLTSVEVNMSNQQVGFCNGGQLPYHYNCNPILVQDLITGKLIADGAGHIVTGSSYSQTTDPNALQCSPKNNPPSVCPYKVPSGNTWVSTTAYSIGAIVDYSSHTYQAVVASTNAPPVVISNGSNPQAGNACAVTSFIGGGGQPRCTWVLLYASAGGHNDTTTGTFTGSYTIQANGIGAMTILSNGKSIGFALAVPPLVAGQQIQLQAQPTLGNKMAGDGTAIRQ